MMGGKNFLMNGRDFMMIDRDFHDECSRLYNEQLRFL